MNCNNCGSEIEEAAEFCPKCLGDPRTQFARTPPPVVVVDALDADATTGKEPERREASTEPEPNWVLNYIEKRLMVGFIVFFAAAGVATSYVPFHGLLADYWWVSVLGLVAAGCVGYLLIKAGRGSRSPDRKWGGMTAVQWAIAQVVLLAIGVAVGATAK